MNRLSGRRRWVLAISTKGHPLLDDEVLIHLKAWRDMLRYATHERNPSWNPPLLSLETARMRDLAWRLTPLQFAVYHALIAEYAAAPVMLYSGKVKGNEGVPRRLPLRRAIQGMAAAGWNKSGGVPRAIDSLVGEELVALSTGDGRAVDGPVVGLVKGGVVHGHGSDQVTNDSAPDLMSFLAQADE